MSFSQLVNFTASFFLFRVADFGYKLGDIADKVGMKCENRANLSQRFVMGPGEIDDSTAHLYGA